MAGPLWMVGNLIADASVIRANVDVGNQVAFTTEGDDKFSATFPAANLHSGRPGKVALVDTAGTSVNVDVDLGSAKASHLSAAINAPGVASYVLMGSATGAADSWTTIAGVADTGGEISFYERHDSATYRYLRHRFTLSASAKLKVGELWLGIPGQLSRSFIWSAVVGRQWHGVSHHTQARNPWAHHFGTDTRSFALTWRGITEPEKDEIDDMLTDSLGATLPILFVPYPDVATDGKSAEVYMVKAPPGYSYVDAHTLSKEVAGLEFETMPFDIEVDGS